MFITLEGIEGSGKTTQIDAMVQFLRQRNIPCLTTREPGGTAIGSQIRSILLNPDNQEMTSTAELLLYTADRAQHLAALVKPALEQGQMVISDRYYDATMVYQGHARGLDKGLIAQLHCLCCQNLLPDITFLLDLPPEIGLKRAWKQIDNGGRTSDETRFEQETLDFHRRVRQGYLELAQKNPDRFFVIDAADKPEQVQQTIIESLSLRIPSK